MRLVLAVAVLGLPTALCAQAYKDGATSDWFKSLSSPGFANCCDQADCKRAESEWRQDPALAGNEGHYWAKSNQTGEWVRIDDDKITRDKAGRIVSSVFNDAILCEGEPYPRAPKTPRVYCFAPPPTGF